MFPRARRLRDKRAYDTLFKRGSWTRGKFFSLVSSSAKDKGKIGFIITKKVAKSAVVRNQSKRRLRAAFLEVLQEPRFAELQAKTAIAVVLHRPTDTVPYATLKEDVAKLLDRLGENA